ncbi:hypothetical protein [Rhizobium etli]|uniref:Uncharacterized protein n=1 Tax=Rhizobium etli TaxID=29449 RepID=A0A7W6ZI19_RHIET|nr:hypothetical protein [Rhizobium etli]MBB4480753.1 hypothetical protein [Rhizobium etli]MBB4536351.1 hypothetical protein [Rhizobium etli]
MTVIREENSCEPGIGASAFSPRSKNQARWAIVALASISICMLVATLTVVLASGVRPLLLREDGIIEMASVACLAAAVLGAVVAFVTWGLRLPFLVAGLIGFAELMDEISFGSRLFDLHPPALYGGGELDGFHDLLILAYRLLRDVNPALAWIWIGLLLAASLALIVFALSPLRRGIDDKRSWLADHLLIFVHIGFIGLAQVIDIATESQVLSAMEEMLEFNAGLTLLFYVAQQAHRSPTKIIPHRTRRD